MARGVGAGAAGHPAAAAPGTSEAPLSRRDLRDLRAVIRLASAEGCLMVTLRHVRVELPSLAHAPAAQARESRARGTARCGSERRAAAPLPRQHKSSLPPACDSAGGGSEDCSCMHTSEKKVACKDLAAKRKARRRGPAALARSESRLLAFNERKRQRLLSQSRLRVKLHMILNRMKYERMWMVKRACAEGREVFPSLSEAMASLLSASATHQPPLEETGSKRAASSTPTSPPPKGGSLAVEGVKPSPLKKPRSGRKRCEVCGYMPYTCTCKYKNLGFRRLQLA